MVLFSYLLVMKWSLYIAVLLFSCLLQGQEKKPSAPISPEDSTLLQGYKVKFAQLINPQPDSALYYAEKMHSFGNQHSYGIGIADAHYLKAQYFRRVQQPDSAIAYFHKVVAIAKEINYARGVAVGYNGLCRIQYLIGDMDEAIKNCYLATEWLDDFEDQGNVVFADTHVALASAFIRQNKMEPAIKELLKVDSTHKKNPIRPDIIAAAYQSLGNIYLELEDYDSSEQYFLLANEEFLKIPGNSFYLETTNQHLGQVYYRKKQYRKADSLLQRSYTFFKGIEDNRTLATIDTYLGLVYVAYERPKEAETYFKEALELHKKYDFDYEASQAGIELSKLYLTQNRHSEAIRVLNEVLSYNQGNKNTLIRQQTLALLADAFYQQQNYKQAFETFKIAENLKDSLQQAQSADKIREIEAIYQTETRDREIKLLTSKNLLVQQQKKNQLVLLLSGLGLALFAGIFFFFQYRTRLKTNQKLKELDKAKSTFFANISHEFRTPLTLIKAPLEDQLESAALSNNDRRNLQVAKAHISRLESLVEQLLALSKLESGHFKLRVQPGNLLAFAKALASQFVLAAEEKQLEYQMQFEEDESISWFDMDALEKIFVNLIGNAIKYTPEKGAVRIKGRKDGDRFLFEVQNSGTYLNVEAQKNIFERFYQEHPEKPGAGIGLSLTKELTELHKGSIEVYSDLQHGTSFSLDIPVGKAFFKKEEILSEMLHETFAESPIEEAETLEIQTLESEDAPILMIVEDHPDIRNYIASLFETQYKIEMAPNGVIGLEKANECIPDIIISDVMMPKLDGHQFTQALKGNPITSHIPIILLTAKAGEQDKLEGLESGADAYVTKPFQANLLKASVTNLLENRRKLQERFSREVILHPKEIALSSAEEKFLEKLQDILDSQLTDPGFSTTEFCEAMGVSRMQLHRKLKAITGQSATEFIRSQRLKLAISLLKTQKANISEIAYSIGFNDPSYFTKCFREAFGCAPSDYPSASK
ncbi:MAG TPA: response regulator [Flavobacteriaceae bacterium]|nr:response regulator [Flavobacteriaceae bacterium]MCB9212824.1 response regulator [Alteromonas sp.]HQU21277.1 response regulator [Flavobacteriaceae bacterium]HQU66062.1 response regulator [Flavobacteriaceae bacterium]HRW43998.1 response regulator [Flavobacteriaceae bacterium]